MAKNGRPSTIDDEKLAALKAAFKLGLSVKGACQMADVSLHAYYRYVEKNPDFRDEVACLRESTVNAAMLKVRKAIEANDMKTIRWFLDYQLKKKAMAERSRTMRALRKAEESKQDAAKVQVVTDAYYERLERELNVKPPVEDGDEDE